jgi:hypothetical protein
MTQTLRRMTETTVADSIVIMIVQKRLRRGLGISVLCCSLASAAGICNRFACNWNSGVVAKVRGLNALSLHELLHC